MDGALFTSLFLTLVTSGALVVILQEVLKFITNSRKSKVEAKEKDRFDSTKEFSMILDSMRRDIEGLKEQNRIYFDREHECQQRLMKVSDELRRVEKDSSEANHRANSRIRHLEDALRKANIPLDSWTGEHEPLRQD